MATTVQNPFDTQQAAPSNTGIVGGAVQNMTTGAPGQTPYQQYNPTPAAGAQTYTPQTREVNAPTETVQGQVNSILAKDSPLMQRARTLATQQMAQRGLVNSSMAVGASTAAMTDRAMQMGAQDAQTYSNRALTNMEATNQGNQFNVGQTNDMFKFGQDVASRYGLQTEQNKFVAGQNTVTQNFQAAQAQLDRAQQTALSDKSIEAQQALQAAQNNFNQAQSALDRTQQTTLQKDQQLFQKDQAALDRTLQSAMQTNQFSFQGTQADKDRTQQLLIQKLQESGMDLRQATDLAVRERMQSSEQTFQSLQSNLDRNQQLIVQDKQFTFQGTQADMDRQQQTMIQRLQETGMDSRQATQLTEAAKQAALDRTQQASLQTSQQEFTAGQNQIQNNLNERMATLEQSGMDFRQAREIASREVITQLEQAGITNRFDQELALKSDMFNVEQVNAERRQIIQNDAALAELGLRINADKQMIPTNFAANISNTAMNGVNAIIADGNLNADAKKAAIDNLVKYANAQIAWASAFYSTNIPPIFAPK